MAASPAAASAALIPAVAAPAAAPAALTALAKQLRRALLRFEAEVVGLPQDEQRAAGQAITHTSGLLQVLESDFGLRCDARRSGRHREERCLRAWRTRFYRANRQLRSLRKTLDELKSKNLRRLTHHWVVSVGLADPHANTRSVASWCREFAIDVEQLPISHASVASVRDAFGNIIWKMNQADALIYAETAEHGFLVLRHLHDEATMRLRSTAAEPAAPPGRSAAPTDRRAPRHGRFSKIQNSVVHLHRSATPGDGFRLLFELQPLDRKDAATLATSLHSVAVSAIHACSQSKRTRLIHCVVGDGVYANGLAASRACLRRDCDVGERASERETETERERESESERARERERERERETERERAPEQASERERERENERERERDFLRDRERDTDNTRPRSGSAAPLAVDGTKWHWSK